MQPPNLQWVLSRRSQSTNPTLPWSVAVPKFFEDLERNEPGASLVTLLAVKGLVMTFLRSG